MNETEKENTKAAVHETAGKIADKAGEAAKTATGWKKWLLAAAAILAGAIAYFTAGCTTYADVYIVPSIERGK